MDWNGQLPAYWKTEGEAGFWNGVEIRVYKDIAHYASQAEGVAAYVLAKIAIEYELSAIPSDFRFELDAGTFFLTVIWSAVGEEKILEVRRGRQKDIPSEDMTPLQVM